MKPHGLRGEVAVDVLSDVPGRFDAGAEVVVGGRASRIVSSREHQGRMLIVFDGVGDRTAAERLRGTTVEAETLDLEGHDTYFAHELVGMAVVADDGQALGVVDALIELPASAGYDLLEVRRDDGSSWLLPAVDDYVDVRADERGADQLVVVEPPEGLIEDGAETPRHGGPSPGRDAGGPR